MPRTNFIGISSQLAEAFGPTFLEETFVVLPQLARFLQRDAAGDGIMTGRHAAPLTDGIVGVLHGNRTYLMQDQAGLISETHSVSAGLDYPGVGPEHAWLKDIERAEYVAVTDEEALGAFRQLNLLEGILPALESSHALAHAVEFAATLRKDQNIIVNLSGRGILELATKSYQDIA